MCNSFTPCNGASVNLVMEGLVQELRARGAALSASSPVAGQGPASASDGEGHGGASGLGQSSTAIFPGTEALVLLAETSPEGDGRIILTESMMRFGIPVEWKGDDVFNARLDSLLRGEGMWAGALAERRCLVPCGSFFETHGSERARSPKTGRTIRQRYEFQADGEGPLLLAAVYQDHSFAVVTTEPNASVSPVHDRMPLVLSRPEAARWLDTGTTLDELAALADRSAMALGAQPLLPPADPHRDDQLQLPL